MIFLEKRETGLKLIFMKDLLNVEKTCRKEKKHFENTWEAGGWKKQKCGKICFLKLLILSFWIVYDVENGQTYLKNHVAWTQQDF